MNQALACVLFANAGIPEVGIIALGIVGGAAMWGGAAASRGAGRRPQKAPSSYPEGFRLRPHPLRLHPQDQDRPGPLATACPEGARFGRLGLREANSQKGRARGARAV